MQTNLPIEISVHDVKSLLDEQADMVLLDCRTAAEREVAAIDPSAFIPIDEMMHRLDELETHRDHQLVVYCHHGQRSEMVCQWLRGNGFSKAQTMIGGIDAWSCQIDGEVRRY